MSIFEAEDWEAEVVGTREQNEGEFLDLIVRAEGCKDEKRSIFWSKDHPRGLIRVLQAAQLTELSDTGLLIGVKFPCELLDNRAVPIVDFGWVQEQLPPSFDEEDDETCPNCGAVLGRDET